MHEVCRAVVVADFRDNSGCNLLGATEDDELLARFEARSAALVDKGVLFESVKNRSLGKVSIGNVSDDLCRGKAESLVQQDLVWGVSWSDAGGCALCRAVHR